jgi:hypothetical protein
MRDLGRRSARPAPTFWAAPVSLAAVVIWGSPEWAHDYYVFVAVTAAVLLGALFARPRVGD